MLIGTPKALPILQGDFRQARRGSGQGDIFWEMMEDGHRWRMFVEAMWTYQYTRCAVPLTDELADALFQETHGLAFLAVVLYKLVQEDAIVLGKESFGVLDIHRVADESLGLTKPMRDALRTGKELDLQKYTDIHPLHYKQFLDNYSVEAEKREPLKKPDDEKVSSREKATLTLMGLGVGYQDACRLAIKVQKKHGSKVKPELIASEAYAEYLATCGQEKEPEEKGDVRSCSGYEGLKSNGTIDTEGF